MILVNKGRAYGKSFWMTPEWQRILTLFNSKDKRRSRRGSRLMRQYALVHLNGLGKTAS